MVTPWGGKDCIIRLMLQKSFWRDGCLALGNLTADQSYRETVKVHGDCCLQKLELESEA